MSQTHRLSPISCPPTPPVLAEGVRTPTPTSGCPEHDGKEKLEESAEHEDLMTDSRKDPKDVEERQCQSPEANCAICLGRLENMSYTDSCCHKFCFTCLLEWSKVRPVCPLCKVRFKSIIHTIKGDDDYALYKLPEPQDGDNRTGLDLRVMIPGTQAYQDIVRFQLMERGRVWEQSNAMYILPTQPSQRDNRPRLYPRPDWRRRRHAATSEFRRQIYELDMWVWGESVMDVTGRYRECSPQWYRNNQAQTHRLVPWLNRELNVLVANNPQLPSYLIQLILDLIQRHEIRSPEIHDRLLPYFGNRTEHFQHEFYNFARSVYDMVGFDRHAVYVTREQAQSTARGNETVVISSDEDDDDEVEVVDVISAPSNLTERIRRRLQHRGYLGPSHSRTSQVREAANDEATGRSTNDSLRGQEEQDRSPDMSSTPSPQQTPIMTNDGEDASEPSTAIVRDPAGRNSHEEDQTRANLSVLSSGPEESANESSRRAAVKTPPPSTSTGRRHHPPPSLFLTVPSDNSDADTDDDTVEIVDEIPFERRKILDFIDLSDAKKEREDLGDVSEVDMCRVCAEMAAGDQESALSAARKRTEKGKDTHRTSTDHRRHNKRKSRRKSRTRWAVSDDGGSDTENSSAYATDRAETASLRSSVTSTSGNVLNESRDDTLTSDDQGYDRKEDARISRRKKRVSKSRKGKGVGKTSKYSSHGQDSKGKTMYGRQSRRHARHHRKEADKCNGHRHLEEEGQRRKSKSDWHRSSQTSKAMLKAGEGSPRRIVRCGDEPDTSRLSSPDGNVPLEKRSGAHRKRVTPNACIWPKRKAAMDQGPMDEYEIEKMGSEDLRLKILKKATNKVRILRSSGVKSFDSD